MKTHQSLFLGFLALLTAVLPLKAGEIGHYAGGIWGPWNFISPAPGSTQILMSVSYYHTGTLKNSSGKTVRGVNVNIDVPQFTLLIGHTFEEKILDARYAFAIIPSYGKSSINAHLASHDIGREKGQRGWSDLYVIPCSMTWDLSKYCSVSGQYSFWAPTGSYHSTRNLNNGLGYWSHDFRVTGSFFPTGRQDLLLSASILYEYNTKKKGVDVHPGDRLVTEFGVSYAVGKHFIPSLIFAGNWEVTKTTGSASTDLCKDVVFSIGPEINIPIVPEKWTVILRYMREFGAKDRTEGNFFYAFLEYQF